MSQSSLRERSIDRNETSYFNPANCAAKFAFHLRSLSFVCLSVAEPPTVVACVFVTKILDNNTYFYQVNADHGSWPADGFCRVISHVKINDGEPYAMTAEIMNVIGVLGANYGHPGVMYNVIDENNFDVVFFRLVLC